MPRSVVLVAITTGIMTFHVLASAVEPPQNTTLILDHLSLRMTVVLPLNLELLITKRSTTNPTTN